MLFTFSYDFAVPNHFGEVHQLGKRNCCVGASSPYRLVYRRTDPFSLTMRRMSGIFDGGWLFLAAEWKDLMQDVAHDDFDHDGCPSCESEKWMSSGARS